MSNNSTEKTDKIAIGLFVAIIVMQLSLLKIFHKFIPMFNHEYNTAGLCVIYMIMMLAIFALVVYPRAKKGLIAQYKNLFVELAVLAGAIVLTDVVTIVKGQLRITNILTHNLDYFYAFLAIPLVILLVENKWKWENFVNVVLALNCASMIFRICVQAIYQKTGIEITCVTREYSIENWVRNGRIRIMIPCMMLLCLPLSVYMIISVNSLIKRVCYLLVAGLTLFYAVYVWQSRVGIILMLGITGVQLLFRPMSKKIAIISWSVVAIGAIAFVAIGGVNKIINLFFSTGDGAKYSGENKGHFEAYTFYFDKFLKSPFFGDGLHEELIYWKPNGRPIGLYDAGILYSLVPMGILMAVFYIIVLVRGIGIYVKYHNSSLLAGLALVITLVIIGGEVAADSFFTPIAFCVPFHLAIIEYTVHAMDKCEKLY